MIHLLAALMLSLAVPAGAQQRALVIGPADAVAIPPRGALQPELPTAVAPPALPRLASQGPARWSASRDLPLPNPWLVAPLAAAAALAVLLPAGGGTGTSSAGVSAGPTSR
ncbi:hypothetical protein [Siccirubricoccus deserti]|uniref:Uncharacterized protein n=1 Tax=Siccirubricoccus deserti TaxID=2013562 RepID=A0A9X0QWQ8_9PROT|nr:hypothetical protein [Siccirubricoccus deserti]MBC4014970.1 hypothetical protein [Siccirubricoccus deserti]